MEQSGSWMGRGTDGVGDTRCSGGPHDSLHVGTEEKGCQE